MSISLIKKYALIYLLLLGCQTAQALSVLSKNDNFPLYTTRDPHAFLYTRIKEQLHGRTEEKDKRNKFSLAISPFGQNADIGRNIDNISTELGNMSGKWSMLGLLMGPTPSGKTLAPTLQAARTTLFPTVPASTPLNIEGVSDEPNEKFGFFEFPATYRKRGLRCQLSVGIFDDLGISIEAGVADINFTVEKFDNLTDSLPLCLTDAGITKAQVEESLMCKLKEIACELGLDLSNFHKNSIEDVRFNLFWRHAFEVNQDNKEWPAFLFIPYLSCGFSAAVGDKKKTAEAFGLPFGNNEHNSAGLTAGINIDFTETIEIGGEVGFTHFFDKHFRDFPVPTSKLQQGIFPFKTNVKVSPGHNWHFGLKMSAHHFLDKLSFYFQWVILEHKNDRITINGCDNDKTVIDDCTTVFKPSVLENISGWKSQMITTALNYDISPNISIGFLWQAPVSQRNVFRSTTIMFGLNLVY